MKRICIIFTVACTVTAWAQTPAQPAGKSTAAKKKKSAPAKNPSQIVIPKGAVLDSADGNYHYTDRNGRKWVYMMTPMGPSRWEDKGGAGAAKPQFETSNRFSRDPNMKAVDQGDSVQFIRSTPFGPQTWTKKKSELTDDERAMIAGPATEAKPAEKAQN